MQRNGVLKRIPFTYVEKMKNIYLFANNILLNCVGVIPK
jgi:hypothetical protein